MSLVEELKRRNVFKVSAAYGVLGWLIIQVVDVLAPRMGLPEWVPGFFIILVLVGFPISVFLTWAFEMTPEGVRRSEDVDRDASLPSAGGPGGHYVIISALVLVVLVQQFAPRLSGLNPFRRDASNEAVSIAVFPFADLSSAGDQEYLGDGVAEEILNVLASVDGLSVTSRTSSFAFKEQNRTTPEIAEVLSVTHVVEGSIRKQNDNVRITAQLIDVANDSHLWSDTYDSTLDDIFRLEDEIAGEISRALSERLDLALPDVERETPDWDPVAHELFLRARQLVVTRTGYAEAIQLAESALVIEPEFADARALIATSLALRAYNLSMDRPTWEEAWGTYDEAWINAGQAISVDSEHPLGLAVQGLIRLNQKRWIEARVHMERALAVPNPDVNAFLWMGILQLETGDWSGAFRTFDRGLVEYPSDPNLLRWYARARGFQGQWEEALEVGELPATLGVADARLYEGLLKFLTGRISSEAYLEWLPTAMLAADYAPDVGDGVVRVTRVIIESTPGEGDELDSSWLNANVGFLHNFLLADPLVTTLRPDVLPAFLLSGLQGTVQGPGQNVFQAYWRPGRSAFLRDPDVRQAVFDLGFFDYWQLYGWPEVCRPVGLDDFECD